jgi:outer membrane lipoprotein carrier protein
MTFCTKFLSRAIVVTAALLFAGQAAVAESQSDDAGHALVDQFLSDVKTMRGQFEQSMIDADGEVIDVSAGMLEIHRPDRFRWVYSEPYEQWLVADGQNIWSYDVDLAQVTVKPQGVALANTPAMLLGGASDALEQFLFEGSFVEDGTTWVRMRPVEGSSGFERLELGFVEGLLNRMVFFDNLEQTTLVVFHDVAVNLPVDDELFTFVVPDDVDLVGEPVAAGEPVD